MLYGSSAAEKWLIEDEPEEIASKKGGKPKFRKVPYAVIDDPRLSYEARCGLGWRYRQDPKKWHSKKSVFERDTGGKKASFDGWIRELKVLNYLTREQVAPKENAKETLNLKAAPPSNRIGFLCASNEDLKLVTRREIGVFDYLRSHSPKYPQSAAYIASKVGLKSEKTVRSICNSLIGKGLVDLVEKRDSRGRITGKGYATTYWEPGAASAPCGKVPTGTKTGHIP